MKILITGGAGYIGTNLCVKLTENPNVSKIVVLDNLCKNNYNFFLHSNLKPEKIEFVKGDLLDSRTLGKILKDIDVVYHLAAEHTNDDKLHHFHEQVNHWGTAELAYAVERNCVKQFVYLSSTDVYACSEHESDYNTAPNPASSFAYSKWRGEQHVMRLMPKINTQIIRLCEVFGYGISMNMNATLNQFLFASHLGNPIQIQGNGNQKIMLISLDKTVLILSNLLEMALESGTYNLLEYRKTVMELVEMIQKQNPDLEMIFTNQHLEFPQRIVKTDERIMKLYKREKQSLTEEMNILKKQFENFGSV